MKNYITIEAKTTKEFKQKIATINGSSLEGTLQLNHISVWVNGLPTYQCRELPNQEFIWINCPKFKNGRYIVQSRTVVKNLNIISSELAHYAANIIDSTDLAEALNISETEELLDLLRAFQTEWDSVEVDVEGPNAEQNARLDAILLDYAQRIYKI